MPLLPRSRVLAPALALAALAACATDRPAPILEKQKPDDAGALVIVIDRSGSMQGPKLEAAKQGALASVDALDDHDLVSVVMFDSEPTVLVPLRPARDRAEITAGVSRALAGGGTNVLVGLRAAHDALRGVKAKVRHVILLSDGEAPYDGLFELAREMKAQQITISTVAMVGADERLLETLSTEGGGRMYRVEDLARLPATFAEDTRLAFR